MFCCLLTAPWTLGTFQRLHLQPHFWLMMGFGSLHLKRNSQPTHTAACPMATWLLSIGICAFTNRFIFTTLSSQPPAQRKPGGWGAHR